MRRVFLILWMIVLLTGCMAAPNGEPTDALPISQDATPGPAPVADATDAPRDDALFAVAAREFLSLRTQPDANAGRIKKLLPGAIVAALSTEGEFSYVREVATGETGYAMRRYLLPLGPDTPHPTPAPDRAPGLYRVEAEEFITLREEPDTGAAALAEIGAGAEVEALEFSGSFARVRAEGGQEGYVLADYLRQALPRAGGLPEDRVYRAEGDIRVVNAEAYLSLRAEPASASRRVMKIPRGARVTLLSRERDFAYVEVENTGERGYVLASYLLRETDFEETPPAADSGVRYVDALEYITLREGPSRSADEIARLERGERVEVEREEGEFAYVTAENGRQGYVSADYLSRTAPSDQGYGTYVVQADEYIALRESASTAAPAVRRLDAGSEVAVLGFDGPFAKVRAGEDTGFVLSGYLRPKDADSRQGIVQPDADYDAADAERDLKALAERYPGQMKVVSAGQSVEGRSLQVAVVGDIDAEHHVFVQAGIHGRENMTTLLVMTQLESLLAAPEETFAGKSSEEWLAEVCFHILPASNPDGAAISVDAPDTPRMREFYASDPAAEGLSFQEYARYWKANANGVDLNRNFPAGWKTLRGPSAPSAERYRGREAGDQPETQALMDYASRYDFDATISYHAYGSVIYWEYGGDRAVLSASRALGGAVRAVTGYPLAGAGGLDAGGFKDWAMEMRSIPSLTVEIGTRACPLPLEEFAAIWERNRQVLPAVAAWVME